MGRDKTINHARRLHPLWIVFSMGKYFKELAFFVIAFAVYINSKSTLFKEIVVIGIIVSLIYILLSVLLEWFHFKYLITEKEICIHEGRFIQEKRYIPLERIQGISQDTPFFHRLFKLTSLLLDTGSTEKKASAKLEMITYNEAERIQKQLSDIDLINKEENKLNQKKSIEKVKNKGQSPKNQQYKVTSKEIFISAVTSLSLFVFASFLYACYSHLKDYASYLKGFFSVDSYINTVYSFFQQSWLLTSLGIIAFFLLSMLFGWVEAYVKYKNFEVTSDHKRIYIKKGLFDKTKFSIPKDKVEAIILNAKFLKKLLGIVEVKIVCTGDEDDQHTLFPFINKKRALQLIPDILPSFTIMSDMTNLPRSAIFIKLVRSSLICIVGAVIMLYFWPKLWYIALALGTLVTISQILSGLFSCYMLKDSFIQYQTGSFSTRLFVTTQIKIEELKITQSILQRNFGLATLKISTRTKSFDLFDALEISDIPMDMADRYYQWYATRNILHRSDKNIG
ncbi:putative membrane protein [Marininema mesophilum]|uniref:Putative membrane protein n=2 Tax=Marininema mesophilum TaxID=1048340 RepID=A0A1H2YWS6_9BACL|nr:putative membrane protein [Marininema mesophilum]